MPGEGVGSQALVVYEERPLFEDRSDAGRRLARSLEKYGEDRGVVLGVPRGGVPVGVRVAEELNIPLDIVVTRKITIPGNPEAGYGAVAEDGTVVLNEPLVARLRVTEAQIRRQAEEVRGEVARRGALFREKVPVSPVEGKAAILIDDGLASGFTMIAAAKSARLSKASSVVVAVPVASGSAYDLIRGIVDDVVCLVIARTYSFAVAEFYHHWHDLTDEEVMRWLEVKQVGSSARTARGS